MWVIHKQPSRLLWSHTGWMFKPNPRHRLAVPPLNRDLQRATLLPLADKLTPSLLDPLGLLLSGSHGQRAGGLGPVLLGLSPLRL